MQTSPLPAPPLRTVLMADTTLRDGLQMPGAHMTPEAQVEVALALAGAGVRLLDIGFPAAGPEQFASTRRIAGAVGGAVLSVLSRAIESDIAIAAEALAGVPAYRRGISVFLPTSPVARERRLRMDEEAMLERVASAVHAARAHGFGAVSFSAEDASRTPLPFLLRVYRAAVAAGASSIGYADTVGICAPEQVKATLLALRADDLLAKVPLAVHFHDDLGMATANSLAAVLAGANIVQCTVNGIGERAGNAALEEVALALALHPALYQARTSVDLARLRALGALVTARSGVPTPSFKAVVGSDIFVTAAGIHQDGLIKDSSMYFPFPPALLGEPGFEFQLNQHSGHAAVRHALAGAGAEFDEADIGAVLQLLKARPGVGVRGSPAAAAALLAESRAPLAAATSQKLSTGAHGDAAASTCPT